eukprot:GEMP01000553.1.p1 GENE.GEMP01000553.1~~GEMP01000553.1.p1  ORF type:complete len:1300 (+),score=265.37 GEMP01000553.1:1515-5414(+)
MMSGSLSAALQSSSSNAQLAALCEKLSCSDKDVQRNTMIGIISAMADRDQNARENAAKSFAAYLVKSDLQLMVTKLLMEHGLRHPNWQTRLHTLLALQHIDIDKLTVLQNLLEEGIGPCLQDPQELVIQAAKQTLTHWETKDLTKEATLQDNADNNPQLKRIAGILLTDLVYGCVSVDVIRRLESPNWQTRSIALEEFHQYLTSVAIPLPDAVKNSVHDVLEKLSGLLKDNNFKITLTTLYIIGDLVDLWGDNVIPVIGAVLQGLLDKLGDNKIVIRQTSVKVFYKIFQQAVSLQQVDIPVKRSESCDMSAYVPRLLQSICSGLSERSSSIRVDFISVIIMAVHVLHQGRCPYNHKMIVQVLMDVAKDQKDKASHVAIEALGFLRARLGPIKMPKVEELLASRLEKITQWGWPTVTSEGLVEYTFISPNCIAPKDKKQGMPLLEGGDAEKEWIPLQGLPEDTDDADALWAKMPFTAVHSVVSSTSDKVSSRLTVSTSSSSSRHRNKGSGTSSCSSDCRRSSLSSSSGKVRNGKFRYGNPPLRVNFADEEVMSVNSVSVDGCPKLYSAPASIAATRTEGDTPQNQFVAAPRLDVAKAQKCAEDNFASFQVGGNGRGSGKGSFNLNSTQCLNQNLDATQHLEPDNVPYVPSGMQRPGTRHISNTRDGRPQTCATKEIGFSKNRAFRQHCFQDKENTELSPSNTDNNIIFKHDRCSSESHKKNDFPFSEDSASPPYRRSGAFVSLMAESEESVSPTPNWARGRGSCNGDARGTPICPRASITPTAEFVADMVDITFLASQDFRPPSTTMIMNSKIGGHIVDDDEPSSSISPETRHRHGNVNIFHKNQTTRRMLESTSPTSPDALHNITDKLRLLKISSRTSSRSNCRSYCSSRISDTCHGNRGEIMSPLTTANADEGDGITFAAERRLRRNPFRLTTRPESTNDFDLLPHKIDDLHPSRHPDMRESLHSAPVQGTRVRGPCMRRIMAGPRVRGGCDGMNSMATPVSPTKTEALGGKSGAAAVQYTTCEELRPFGRCLLPNTSPTSAKKPECGSIKDIFRRLKKVEGDWFEQFEALDDLRRLAKFHPSNELCRNDSKGGCTPGVGEHYRFQHAFPLVIHLCDSPRSALAKNAIICLHDLYSLLPSRCVESSADLAMPMLLRKSVDTNGFVSEEAMVCLRQMSSHISIQKLIPATLAHQQAVKSAAARSKGLLFICWVLLRIGDIDEVMRYKDATRLFTLICTSLEDASAEVRQMARLAVQCLCDISTGETDGVSPVVGVSLSKDAFNKMQQCALQPRTKVPFW